MLAAEFIALVALLFGGGIGVKVVWSGSGPRTNETGHSGCVPPPCKMTYIAH
jgi:hypothetical protein